MCVYENEKQQSSEDHWKALKTAGNHAKAEMSKKLTKSLIERLMNVK